MDGSKFREQFLKRVTQGTFLWNHFKIRPAVSEKKIFKELLKKFNFVAMATRVFDGINFWRGPPKEHSCQVWSKLAQRFGRRRYLKKLLTTHDGRLTTLKAPLERIVLKWAKNKGDRVMFFFALHMCSIRVWSFKLIVLLVRKLRRVQKFNLKTSKEKQLKKKKRSRVKWFLCTALLHMVFLQYAKFQADSFYSL